MLQLDEVVKHYRVGDGEIVRAVDGVCLSVAAGELVALYGPSGSGKTTLLMLIAGLLVPDSGSVRVNGREVSRLSARERAHYRRSELGFIRQSLDLIPGVRADDNAALKLLASTGRRDAQRQSGAVAGAAWAQRSRPTACRAALDGRAPASHDRASAVHRTQSRARRRAHR